MNRQWRNWQSALIPAAMIAVGITVYLLVSQAKIGLGFPLDDAWIHQTYARNLGQYGEWAFLPGQKSAGSTGPLWSGLLSLAYALEWSYTAWTYLLGSVALMAIAYLAGAWFARRAPNRSNWRWVVMAVVGLEWHLLWSALSGMETIAFILANLAVLYLIERPSRPIGMVGLLIGIGFWLRPEAVLLFLPVVWALLFDRDLSIRTRISRLVPVVGLFLIVAAPYLAMNYLLVGELWPTTFFAKQAEYAFLRQDPLLYRLFHQVAPPLTGVGIVLLPGMLMETAGIIRKRDWRRLAPLVWVAAFLGTYALRLPVNYQYGRYAMPVIPVLLVVSSTGMARWLQFTSKSFALRVGSKVWASVAALVVLAFVGIGANAYATDVAIIEMEMVAASRWIRENTPRDALIAAHDIGALGYFGDRQILDLAGLISPEVIPILWNEAELTNLLDNHDADYLMTFPGWYPQMTEELQALFISQEPFSPSRGGENMAVYAWPGD